MLFGKAVGWAVFILQLLFEQAPAAGMRAASEKGCSGAPTSVHPGAPKAFFSLSLCTEASWQCVPSVWGGTEDLVRAGTFSPWTKFTCGALGKVASDA